MTLEQRGLAISAILNYVETNIKDKNHKLASCNLYDEQEKFDKGDMFFKLAFMEDSDLEKISKLILN